ncbi:tetratricopeptide repeat protein [Methylacidiphilales bacterium]|nr:tetratricopeptide repeat protein [Candidatus Methylacidiphilales bacterium]
MAHHPKKKKRSLEIAPAARSSVDAKSPVTNWKLFWVQVAVIVVTGLWIFWPALHGGWIGDDETLIEKNPFIHSPHGIWIIWLEPSAFMDYFPIKISVEWLEWQLWQNDTFGYHLNNVILHIISALLIWRLLSKLGVRLAWLGGLIFVLHPATVESVGWITELKNTLSLPPFLLAMCFFIDYDERGKLRDCLLALGFFLVAMLCKTSMVMFPFVILLYAWWKRGRIRRNDLKTSVFFLVISFGLGLVTLWFLHHHGIVHHPVIFGGFFPQLALIGLSIAFYFSKCVWPVILLPVYPRWVIDPPSLWQFLPWPVLGGVIFWLWTKRATWGRHALLGLGFFLIMLAPFVGLTAGSYMTFSWVMDHFLYIPLIGLIGLAVAGLGEIEKKLSPAVRSIGIGIVTVTLALLAWGSHAYAEMYGDQEKLWAYNLEFNPRSLPAHLNLGNAFLAENRFDEAMEQFYQVLKIDPDYAGAHNNLGIILYQKGSIPEAIEEFRKAAESDPYDANNDNNYGFALARNNRIPEAIKEFEIAVKENPHLADAHKNLALSYWKVHRIPDAIEQYEFCLRLNPNDEEALHYLEQLESQTPTPAR